MAKKNKKKGHLIWAAIALIASFMAVDALAFDRDISASAVFRVVLALTQEDMSFGTIEVTEGAGANDVTLAALDGTLTCSNTSEYTCPPNATPGEIGVVGGAGNDVDIFCESSGTLSNGTDTLDMNNVEIAQGGAAYSCAGMGSAATSYSISGDPVQDKLNLGGKVVITASGVGDGGSFSTAQSGGTTINVRVVYQ